MAAVEDRVDLPALRDIFAALEQAVDRSDIVAVERSAAALVRFVADPPAIDATDRAMLVDLDRMSAGVAQTLASRLRAYDMAIAAWREAEGNA